jgi:hypothetical protein
METMKRSTETEDQVRVAGIRLFVKSLTDQPSSPTTTATQLYLKTLNIINSSTKPSSFELAVHVDLSPSPPARVALAQQ